MIGPGTIVDGLGEETHYVLIGKVGENEGQMAVPINAKPDTPPVVELIDGFYAISDPGAVLAKFGPQVAAIRRKYKLPQPRG